MWYASIQNRNKADVLEVLDLHVIVAENIRSICTTQYDLMIHLDYNLITFLPTTKHDEPLDKLGNLRNVMHIWISARIVRAFFTIHCLVCKLKPPI